MALSKLIKSEGSNSSFIWKYPDEDFNSMTEIIVHEGQEAIFFSNGQATDTISRSGRYRLNSENIPVLSKILNLVTGISIFHCEVYFINKTVQMSVKWGTDTQVRFFEPTLGVPVEIGASGEMNLAVSDGRKLLVNLVGTANGIAWEDDDQDFAKSLQKSFRPLISTAVKANLSAAIKQQNIDIVEIDEHLETLSDALKAKILPGFEEYGLTIPQFYITNIVLPENDANFKNLRRLHTIPLQKRMVSAEAEVVAARREVALEEQTTETEIAKREAERKLIKAQTEAQETRIAGLAEADVMKAQGYNQKDVIQADVQKAYAEGMGNMAANGGASTGSTIVGDILRTGIELTAMNEIIPRTGEILKNISTGENNAAEQPAQTVKCPKCGKELPANAKFCPECGQKVEILGENEMICPECGKKTPKGKFCIECGHPLVNKCPNCGTEVPQGSKFCSECGTKLG